MESLPLVIGSLRDGNGRRKDLARAFWLSHWADLPHPITDYDEWFNSDLESAASSADRTVENLRAAFCHEDAQLRAWAYLDLAQYHGFENFDSDSLTFTSRKELEARYKSAD